MTGIEENKVGFAGHDKIAVGAIIAEHRLQALSGAAVSIPNPQQLVHLQFRRFAGCPVCDLHLRAFMAREREISAAGIREVVIFHSSEEALRTYIADLPFDVIGDPEKRLYRLFGVESAPRALLSPRAWLPIARAVFDTLGSIRREGRPMPPLKPDGGRFGLPADFLIASDGRLLARKYGEHAYDQWSVDELIDLARAT